MGTFDKWDASMAFTSPDVTTGVLDIQDSSGKREYRKRKGTGSGEITGTMAFDRMEKGIPFIKIADPGEVTSTSKGSESAGLEEQSTGPLAILPDAGELANCYK